MAALVLRHVIFETSGKVFVLGGKVVNTVKGVATIETDGPDGPLVALSLWHLGYRIDEDGNEIRNPGDLEALLDGEPAEQADETPDEDEEETEQVDAFVAALTAEVVEED